MRALYLCVESEQYQSVSVCVHVELWLVENMTTLLFVKNSQISFPTQNYLFRVTKSQSPKMRTQCHPQIESKKGKLKLEHEVYNCFQQWQCYPFC